MRQTIITALILVSPILSIGQSQSTLTNSGDTLRVYVLSRSKILLNQEKMRISKLENHLMLNQITQAKIGTLKPTPLDVFPTFEKVIQLMEKYNVEATWYSDMEFQKPFFDN